MKNYLMTISYQNNDLNIEYKYISLKIKINIKL